MIRSRLRSVVLYFLVPAAAFLGLAWYFWEGDFGEYRMSAVGGGVKNVLCYGDSLTVGFHSYGRGFSPYGKHMQAILGPSYKVLCF